MEQTCSIRNSNNIPRSGKRLDFSSRSGKYYSCMSYIHFEDVAVNRSAYGVVSVLCQVLMGAADSTEKGIGLEKNLCGEGGTDAT